MTIIKVIRSSITVLIILGLVLALGVWIVNPIDAQAVQVQPCPADPSQRLAAPAQEQQARLSVFTDLLGTWKGRGYNLIPLPVSPSSPKDGTVFSDPKDGKGVFRVEAQVYDDEITFELVGCVPNRGNNRDDQFAKAIAYRQRATVSKDGRPTPIHAENGMLLVLEPDESTDPDKFVIARLASVPHGDSILAMGRHADIIKKDPEFPPLDSRPINNTNGSVDTNPSYLEPYTVANESLGLTAAEIQNPNLLLQNYLQQQSKLGRKVTQTAVVSLSTKNAGGIHNIPFTGNVTNLNVPSMDFTIWIEQVKDSKGQASSQLQYSQNTMLDFNGFLWPHIDVSSLVKQ